MIRNRLGFVLGALVPLTSACGASGTTSNDTEAVGASQAPLDDDRREQPHDVLYVESNDPRPGLNSILAYRRHADGSLAALAGSPFLTGGTGYNDPNLVVLPGVSDQNIVVNDRHTLLFAVNSGVGNSVAVFHIRSDGGLVAVKGSPYPSGGVNPVSLGIAGDKLVVVNKNEDPAQDSRLSTPNYSVFKIAEDGSLKNVTTTTPAIPQVASPSQALVTPGNRFVYDAWVFGGLIEGLRLTPRGALEPIPGLPVGLPDNDLPFGLFAHPFKPVLYVGEASMSHVTVYDYDRESGELSLVEQAQSQGVAPCWFAINAPATHLYSINTNDHSVSQWDIADARHPVENQHLQLPGPCCAPTRGGFVLQTALDPRERFLYVVQQRFTADGPSTENALQIIQISQDGVLSEAPGSPFVLPVPKDAHPQGLVVL